MPPVPTINLNDELTLRTAVSLQPRDFDDGTHAAIATAMSGAAPECARRGTIRSPSAASPMRWPVGCHPPRALVDPHPFPVPPTGCSACATCCGLDNPASILATLARWGVIGDSVDGRLTTRIRRSPGTDSPRPTPACWRRRCRPHPSARRGHGGAAYAGGAHPVVAALRRRTTGTRWARFADDWPALTHGATSLPASKIEDYIAALGSGGLRGPVKVRVNASADRGRIPFAGSTETARRCARADACSSRTTCGGRIALRAAHARQSRLHVGRSLRLLALTPAAQHRTSRCASSPRDLIPICRGSSSSRPSSSRRHAPRGQTSVVLRGRPAGLHGSRRGTRGGPWDSGAESRST